MVKVTFAPWKLSADALTDRETVRPPTGRFFHLFLPHSPVHLRPRSLSPIGAQASKRRILYGCIPSRSQAEEKQRYWDFLSWRRATARRQKQTNRRSSRLVGLVILTLIGMWLLGGMTALAAHAMSMQTHAIAGQAFPATSPSPRLDKLQRRQAGGVQAPSQKLLAQTLMVAAFCLPTDLPCLLNTAMQWATQQLVSVFQPLIDAINRSPLNFITQTPICVSACPTQQSPYPQNATIGTFVSWSVGVVDAAVAVFIVLAGYNIMMARQIGASYADVAEVLPRIALSVMTANLCLFFLQCFIDLENALC